MNKPLLTNVLSAVVGALTAAAVVSLMRAAAPADAPASQAAALPEKTSRDVVVRYDEDRVARLEGEVRGLRGESNSESARASQEAPPLDPEEERIMLEEHFVGLDQQFSNDTVDATWSKTAGNHLRDGLSALGAQRGFRIAELECRSQFCRANMVWKDYAAAQAAASLPEHPIPGLNCMRSMWLPEPESPEAPYTAAMYLDCVEQRAGVAEPFPVASK